MLTDASIEALSPAQMKALALELFKLNQAAESDKDALRQERDLAEAKTAVLEDETEFLLRRISELTLQLARASGQNEQLALELELKHLKSQLSSHNDDKYGTKSERRSSGKNKKDKKKQAGHGPTPQPHLPIEEVHHKLSSEDSPCTKCGGQLRAWTGRTQVSEQITVVRRSFKILKHHQHIYRCKCCTHLETAKGPEKLIPGGRYSLDFAIDVAIQKYADHQPLERQVRAMKREGLVVTSQTLWDQLHALYILALPSYLALHDEILTHDLIHADETTWRLMNRNGSKKWWIWGVCVPAAICYLLLPSRSAAAARLVFKNYAGTVMADGYAAYAKLANEKERRGVQMVLSAGGDLIEQPTPNFTLTLCWMHARRPFFKAEKAGSKDASVGLDIIAELYQVEKEAKEAADGDAALLLKMRKRLREEKSKNIVDRLYRWGSEQKRVLPRSHLGRGLAFLEKHRIELTRFLTDPKVPIDNGDAERGMRGPVLGRKNHYGSRSETGTLVAAVFYSLIETCKRSAIDPHAYLSELASRAMKEPGVKLLPSEFGRQADG